MFAYRKFGLAAATAAAALAVTAGSAGAHQLGHDFGHWDNGRAVFVQTDNPSGNTIAVYDRNPDGTLTAAGTYATGGDGAVATGSVVDHLASQDSLKYDADTGELFAVNAGSNTVSVFDVQNGDRLHLRQVVNSGGTFPASIAVHGDLVEVLNATGDGAIQGFRVIGGRLWPIPGSNRSLGLGEPAGAPFVDQAGDIGFSADGGQLLVTTKNASNAVDVFSIDRFGEPSATPVVNNLGNVPFALAFQGADQVDVVEAQNSSVNSFTLNGDGTLTPISSVLTGQAATCWVVADGLDLFAGNAGSGSESSVLSSWSGQLTPAGNTTTDAGTVDATTTPDGRYLYVQTGAAGIVDEFAVGSGGSLTEVGSVTVPNAIGAEGIATS